MDLNKLSTVSGIISVSFCKLTSSLVMLINSVNFGKFQFELLFENLKFIPRGILQLKTLNAKTLINSFISEILKECYFSLVLSDFPP